MLCVVIIRRAVLVIVCVAARALEIVLVRVLVVCCVTSGQHRALHGRRLVWFASVVINNDTTYKSETANCFPEGVR